jgi:hypothetical protein
LFWFEASYISDLARCTGFFVVVEVPFHRALTDSGEVFGAVGE